MNQKSKTNNITERYSWSSRNKHFALPATGADSVVGCMIVKYVSLCPSVSNNNYALDRCSLLALIKLILITPLKQFLHNMQ